MGKRVCILTSVHGAFDTRIFHKQARSLVKAGYEVTLIAQHNGDEIVDGVRIVALPRPRNRLTRMLGGWRVLRLAWERQADVYHFHDPELLPVGLLLKLLTKAKVIYDVHEDCPADILTKYWLPARCRRPASVVFDVVERTASRRMDCVVAATDSIGKRFRQGNLIVVRNYPLPVAQETLCGRGSGSRSPALVYAGVLSEDRGIAGIVEAMGHLDSASNARLVLYGDFVPESYKRIVQDTNGFDRVTYMGWIRAEDVWRRIAEATVGLVCFHPDENNVSAMPTKLFEYMAAGLPVIASNFPLWREIVEGNSCGITVNPLEPKDIAGAMQQLIDHPDEARLMGENGRRAVLEKYNWGAEEKRLLVLYDTVFSKEIA